MAKKKKVSEKQKGGAAERRGRVCDHAYIDRRTAVYALGALITIGSLFLLRTLYVFLGCMSLQAVRVGDSFEVRRFPFRRMNVEVVRI
jgi:hypothetical protein